MYALSPPRADVFVRTVGEATLVVELRDSESSAILARIADRRAANTEVGRTVQTSVNSTPEVRRMARHWARLLRQRLEAAMALPAAADAL